MAASDRTEIEWTVLGMKKDLSVFDYKAFLRMLHYRVSQLLETKGQEPMSCCVHKGDDSYGAVTLLTDKADHLIQFLGYQDWDEAPDLFIHLDFEGYQARLETFCKVSEDELVSKGDPLARQPLSDSGLIENDMKFSVEAVETTATRLHAMEEGCPARVLWDVATCKTFEYVTSRSAQHNRHEVDTDIATAALAIKKLFKRRVSFQFYPLFNHLQHTQALIARTIECKMLRSEEVVTYLTNSVEISSDLFTEEYGHSMDTIRALMGEALTKELSPKEVEQVHTVAIWQSENFYSHLKKGTTSHRSNPSQVRSPLTARVRWHGMAGSASRQAHVDESVKATVKEVLDVLKETVGYFPYRNFVRVVHFGVERLVKGNGGLEAVAINKNEPNFAVVATMTDVGINLMYLLGYTDIGLCPDAMVMSNYHESEPRLRAFLDVGREELMMTHGDPAAATPISTIEDTPSLVAHLAYFFELRCHLLSVHSVTHLTSTMEGDVRMAITAVEEVADKLGVMMQGGETRRFWNTTKQNLVKYVMSPEQEQRRPLHDEICAVGHKLSVELVEYYPLHLACLISYLNMVQAATGIAATGELLTLSGTEAYLQASRPLLRSGFTSEYIRVHDQLCEIMRQAQTRPCSETEIFKVFSLSSWQSDNFLSAFRPQAYNVADHIPTLGVIRTGIGMDLSSPDDSHQGRQLHMEIAETIGDSDDEEKQDVSGKVKPEAGEVSFLETNAAAAECQMVGENAEETAAYSGQGIDCEYLFLNSPDSFSVEQVQLALPALRRSGKLVTAKECLSKLVTKEMEDVELLRQSIEELRGARCSDVPVVFLALEEAEQEKEQELEKAQLRLSCLRDAMRMVDKAVRCRRLQEIETETVVGILRKTLQCLNQSPDVLRNLLHSVAYLGVDAVSV